MPVLCSDIFKCLWLLHRWIIGGYYIIGYQKKAGFASRCKSNVFRDEEEPEMDKVSWDVSAKNESQEHNNQMQEV